MIGVASPSIEPPPTMGPAPQLDPTTAGWTKLELTGGIDLVGIDLVGFDRGYVTLGSRDPFENPVAWFSSDGAAWQASPLANLVPNCPGWGPEGDEQVPDADTAAIASNGHQIVVVGSFQPHDAASCATLGYVPVAWTSNDGRTWKRSEPFYGGSSGRATAVWPIEGGWQAVAPSTHSGTDAIWQSADGLVWRLAADLGQIGFLGIESGAATDGTMLVSGSIGSSEENSPRLASSHDGVGWSLIEETASCGIRLVQILPPSDDGAPAWIAHGDTRVCTSVDLSDWTSPRLPMVVSRIAHTRFGVIAIGDVCVGAGDECPEEPELKAFISGDGFAWDSLVHPPIAFGRAMADGPAGVLMIGTAFGGETVEAWRLDP